MKRKPDSAPEGNLLRRIPSVDELVTAPRLTDLAKRVNRALVVETARSVVARLRSRATKENKGAEGKFYSADLSDQLITEIISEIDQLLQPLAENFFVPCVSLRQ